MTAPFDASAAAAWSTAWATWALVAVGGLTALVALLHLLLNRSESRPVVIVRSVPVADGSCKGFSIHVEVENRGQSAAYCIELVARPTDPAHGRGDWRDARYSRDVLAPGESFRLPWLYYDDDWNRHVLNQFIDVAVTHQRSPKPTPRWAWLAGKRTEVFRITNEPIQAAFTSGLTETERRLVSPIPPGPPATYEARRRVADARLNAMRRSSSNPPKGD